jgi:hypothetical protein
MILPLSPGVCALTGLTIENPVIIITKQSAVINLIEKDINFLYLKDKIN